MNAETKISAKLRHSGKLVHRNVQRGRIKGQPSYRRSLRPPPPLKPTDMRCSEEVLDTEMCFQTSSLTHPLVGLLYGFGCAIVRVVVHPRRRTVLRPAACLPSSPSTPSGIQRPSSPDDDPMHQYHVTLAQRLHPFLSPICNWLEEDDVQIAGGLPISAGGFADLWKGSLETRQVAIKSYRRYSSFDLSRVFLVCVHSLAS